jgi:hypothetical protein
MKTIFHQGDATDLPLGVGAVTTLEKLLRWAEGLGATLIDVVALDEFDHASVVLVRENLYLVFDTT